VRRHIEQSFPHVRTYVASVITYPGVLWSFTIGARTHDPLQVSPQEIERRLGGWNLRYYTPSGHGAAFALPPYLRDAVAIP